MMTKIGIIGNGNVGSALEQGLKRTSHEVRSGGNDPAAVREMADCANVVGTSNWIYAIDDKALLEGRMAATYPKGVNVLLARVGGDVYAVSGKCAHMGCPLFMGKLEGYTVTCPCHDWRFDVRTGKFLDAAELGAEVYSTKTEAGKVFINLT